MFSPTNEELKSVIGNNADYYLNKFDEIANGKKPFNLAAFVFAPFMLLYRKLVLQFLLLFLIPYLIMSSCLFVIIFKAITFDFSFISNNTAGVYGIIMILCYIYLAFSHATCGIKFNTMYRKKIFRDLEMENLDLAEGIKPKKQFISRKASMALPVAFFVIYACFNLLITFGIVFYGAMDLINNSGDDIDIEDIPGIIDEKMAGFYSEYNPD